MPFKLYRNIGKIRWFILKILNVSISFRCVNCIINPLFLKEIQLMAYGMITVKLKSKIYHITK
jgi:hypothetical protein